jgi:hypothetical protein
MKPAVGEWYRFREGSKFTVAKIAPNDEGEETLTILFDDPDGKVYSEWSQAEWDEHVREGFIDNSPPP